MFVQNLKKSLRQRTYPALALIFGLLFSGGSMADTVTPNPPLGDHVKVVDAAGTVAEIALLHAEVEQFLRGSYAIKSGNYYRFRGDVPWVAIAKNVHNQMAEKSIQRVIYGWNNPGYDFVEVYPQGDTAFAVAMHARGDAGQGRLVGYFVLTARK
jgi:hypothetical protein